MISRPTDPVPTEAERLRAWRERKARIIANPSLFVALVRRLRGAKTRKP